jgi:hypothetical protein
MFNLMRCQYGGGIVKWLLHKVTLYGDYFKGFNNVYIFQDQIKFFSRCFYAIVMIAHANTISRNVNDLS